MAKIKDFSRYIYNGKPLSDDKIKKLTEVEYLAMVRCKEIRDAEQLAKSKRRFL